MPILPSRQNDSGVKQIGVTGYSGGSVTDFNRVPLLVLRSKCLRR